MANVISKIIKNWTEYQIYGSGGAAWAGDVTWPSSATSWHLAVFDWTTGKVIKDWWAVPTVPTKVSQLQNDAWYTTNIGTITWITMNSTSKGTSWVVDLGTVITSHQSIKTINWNTMTWTGNVQVWTLTAETVSSWDSWTNYVVKVSNSAPASWTASNIITFVLDN